jgi:hypothetical protein
MMLWPEARRSPSAGIAGATPAPSADTHATARPAAASSRRRRKRGRFSLLRAIPKAAASGTHPPPGSHRAALPFAYGLLRGIGGLAAGPSTLELAESGLMLVSAGVLT